MNKLPPDTARLLSSLQVITRVENVVKELVENALDADATCVEVKYENYGLSKVEIRDNGSGINQADVEFVAQRHYTSKISCKEDLYNLRSYGFRGEALNSLCDVAEVFITTRTKSDAFSTKYSLNHNGVIVATKPCHLVQGTTVVANNLFANMPVRYQYYQTLAKKKQIIKNTEDVLMSFSLIHPEKRFSFVHNKAVIWQKAASKDLQNSLQVILGANAMSKMVQVEHKNERSQVHFCAFIPVSPETRHYRKTNDRCFVSINKRPVRDKEIEKIIRQHTSVRHESSTNSLTWPVAVLGIEVACSRVDSNIEADKTKVMISDKKSLLVSIDQMLTEAYGALPQDVSDMEKENRVEEPMNRSASQWSKGHSAVDSDGVAVQPVKTLAGHHGCPVSDSSSEAAQTRRNFFINKRNSGDMEGLTESLLSKDSLPNSDSVLPSTQLGSHPNFSQESRLKQTQLHITGMRSRMKSPMRMSKNSTTIFNKAQPKKRKTSSPLSTVFRNAACSTEMIHEEKIQKNPGKIENSVSYANGQEVHFEFDLEKIRENLFYKKDYHFAERDLYTSIGVLKDLKAGFLLDNTKHKLLLVNLLRLQEAKLFWSLMENQSLHTREASVTLPLSALTAEERMGLKKMGRSVSSIFNPDTEITDSRLCKNGFKVKLVAGSDGTETLFIYGMASMPYYNIDDMRLILQKAASCEHSSVAISRPHKVVQFLQAEAVRMSYSTPVHSSIMGSVEDLRAHFTGGLETWKCFHNKHICHLLLNLNPRNSF